MSKSIGGGRGGRSHACLMPPRDTCIHMVYTSFIDYGSPLSGTSNKAALHGLLWFGILEEKPWENGDHPGIAGVCGVVNSLVALPLQI